MSELQKSSDVYSLCSNTRNLFIYVTVTLFVILKPWNDFQSFFNFYLFTVQLPDLPNFLLNLSDSR